MKILIQFFKIRYSVAGIVFFLTSPLSLFAQSLCSGTLGNAIISKTFGTGDPMYNTAPASDFGFSTTFEIWNKQNTDDGYYSIVNRVPNDFNFAWHNGALDHTNDVNGYMLLVNGDETLGEFYRDTVDNLCKGANYEFSSYVANILRFKPGSILPSVRYEIRDIDGNLLNALNSGDIPNVTSMVWLKKGITFKASTPSVILVMISTAPGGDGNDIVIDDIEFRPCSPITTNITPVAQVCENGNATLTVTLSGNSDYQYSQWQKSTDKGQTWNYIGSLITQAVVSTNYTTNLSLSNLTLLEDSMRYRLIVGTDPGNLVDPNSTCNVISPVSLVLVSSYPVLTITDPAAVCDKKVDLTLAAITTGSTFPKNTVLTYFSTLANANASTNAISTANAKIISTSGTYYIKASTSTIPTCTTSKPVNVRIGLLKKIMFDPIASVCISNPDFQLKATFSNLSTAIWTTKNGDILQSGIANTLNVQPTASELAKDSMWIKVASNDSPTICPNVKDSIKILFTTGPTLQLPNDTLICAAKAINLQLYSNATNSDSVVWKSSGTILPIPKNDFSTFLNLTSTSFFKIVATAYKKGCKSATDSLEIKFDIKPNISATATPTCQPDLRVLLNGTESKNKAIWKSAGTGNFKNANTSISNEYIPSKTDSSNKTVDLVLTSTSQVYCPTKDTTIVWTIIPLPMANAGLDTNVCIGSVVKRSTIQNVDWKYEWKYMNNNSFVYDIQFNATKDTSVLFLKVTNNRNCSVEDSANIFAISAPVIELAPSICLSQDTIISANVKNPPALGVFDWTKNNVSLANSAKSIWVNSVGVYYYEYHFNGNCRAKDSIIVHKTPKLILKDTAACENSEIKLVANSIVGASYFWGNSTASSHTLSTNIKKGILNLKVIVADTNACRDTAFVNAIAHPLPVISIPRVYKYCYETDAPLVLSSNAFAKYKWFSEGILMHSSQSISVSPEQDTFYELEVENAGGCKDTAKLLVRKVCKPRLFVPNVITPASNDINAALHVFGKHYTRFEMSIFNRWGEIIFHSKDEKEAWNGQYLNEDMPIGNYQWQVTYEGDTEEYKGPYSQTGDVAVIR